MTELRVCSYINNMVASTCKGIKGTHLCSCTVPGIPGSTMHATWDKSYILVLRTLDILD